MKLPAFVSDPWIRHKTRLHAVDTERFHIRLARTTREYQDAFRLVHVGYVFQGIEPIKELDLRMTEQHVLSEATVLVAYEGEQLVGTISITKDSPAGLPLDKDYPEALTRLRNEGGQLVEVGSLAVVRRCWHSSLMPLLGMAAARVGFRVLGGTHQVIGVHPKATGFYRAIWNFHPLGRAQRHTELSAPVIGLFGERESIRAHLTRCFQRPMESEAMLPVEYMYGPRTPRSLYLPEDVPVHEWPRFKMSRDVFRELFIERGDRLASLSPRTIEHLRTQRTEQTVGMKSETVQDVRVNRTQLS